MGRDGGDENEVFFLLGKEKRVKSPLTLVPVLRTTGSKLNSKFNLEKEMEKILCKEQDCVGSRVDSMI